VASEEHVGDIEKSVRTIKDGTRIHINRLPFHKYPRAMVAGAAMHALISINQVPSPNGLSDTLSPSTLITGEPTPDYHNIIRLNFGDYVLTAPGKTKNDQSPRRIGAIALYPSKNASGGWYFMSLTTGQILHRYSWNKMPIADDVVNAVHLLADKQSQKSITNNFAYSSEPGTNVNELRSEHEIAGTNPEDPNKLRSEYEINNEQDDQGAAEPIIDIPTIEPNIENEIAEETPTEMLPDAEEPDRENDGPAIPEMMTERESNEESTLISDGDQRGSNNGSNQERLSTPGNQHDDDNLDEGRIESEVLEEVLETENEDIESTESVLTPPIDLRDVDHREDEQEEDEDNHGRESNRLRLQERINYKELHSKGRRTQMIQIHRKVARKLKKRYKVSVNDTFRRVLAVIMATVQTAAKHEQISMKEGIKRFGEQAIEAVLKEYGQLDSKEVFDPVDATKLTYEEKAKALDLLTMVKKKRCGKVKGRACVNGKRQRKYMQKEDVSSPTIQLESLILSLIVDAFERRDIATADIAGAYLNANMPDFILIKLREDSVDILCACNSKYLKYVTMEKGKKVLYLRLAKALYGCLQSALLWYQTFVEHLEELGFRLNPYDPCVANMEINGKQCTICWYVDDTKISHEDPEVVTWVIKEIEKKFGKMSVVRGNEYIFVGMKFATLENGKLKITMDDYVEECIKGFEDENGVIKKKANTPGKHGLFKIDDSSKGLSERRRELFHHIVSKLLYVSKRARIDIDLVISFLCTRVTRSTDEDWGKLERLLTYLKCTLKMPRIISADRLDTIKSWVDASYATHEDMRGHTGGVISMGNGVVNTRSGKQKINTKSSTETEVVGASDFLPWTVWTKRFLKAQGHEIKSNIYYQDNESAMKIEMNGRKSCGEKSRHIHIRYFFIKDIIQMENIEIRHCKTDKMLADYFTKPLQGALFQKMRDRIMGLSDYIDDERVDGNEKASLNTSDQLQKTYAEAVISG